MILTDALIRNLEQKNLEPIMVLEIEDVPFLVSSSYVQRYARYGDEGLTYGMPGFVYGGLAPYPNQKVLISLDGTTTQIRQNLNPDKARGSGISQMTIALLDKNQDATKIIAGTYGEVLNKRVKVWISFGQTGWKEDYILIFRGIIESASADQGLCKIYLNAPQQNQRQLLAPKVDSSLNGAINDSQTTITLANVDNLFIVPDHPAYSPKDPGLKSYVIIENEIIEFTGISGLDLTGCVRGSLGTLTAAHADATEVTNLYVVEGNAMDIALKVILSDANQTPYIQAKECSNVGFDTVDFVDNAFFFTDVSFTRDYNVQIGDYVKSAGFSNGANNLSNWTEILDIVEVYGGSYIVVDAALTYETGTTGTVDFLSKWNSFGAFGLGLDTDEVDIDRHVELKTSFLTSFDLRFYVVDEIEDGREWIEKELYLPASCYSLPSDREGLSRISLGIHKAPIPGTNIVQIDYNNVLNPQSLAVKRSINKYHYNAIAFLFQDTPFDPELRRRVLTTVGTPTIPTGNKALVIESRGMREDLGGKVNAQDSALRLLERYKSAAETIEGVQIHFSKGVQITVGDIVLFDPTRLNVMNRETQNRDREPLLMEVVDRAVDIKNGSVRLDLIQTNFDANANYGLISPASKIATVISSTKFVITYLDVAGPYGNAEYRNWVNVSQPAVLIRKADWSQTHSTRVLSFSANTVTIETAVPWGLAPGDLIEYDSYTALLTRDQQKLVYAYLTDGSNPFPDGGQIYVII